MKKILSILIALLVCASLQATGQATSPNGTIKGRLRYPSDGLPTDLRVTAENIKTGEKKTTSASDINWQAETYTLKLKPGDYYVYCYLTGTPNSPQYYYTEFVTCGSNVNCPSHKKIIVSVKQGVTLSKIDPSDFYEESLASATENASFNIHSEITRIIDRRGFDTSVVETAENLTSDLLVGYWEGYIINYSDPIHEKFQKLDIEIDKVLDTQVYAHLKYYYAQTDTSQKPVLQTEGDIPLSIRDGKLIIPRVGSTTAASIMQPPQGFSLDLLFVPWFDGYWIRSYDPELYKIYYIGLNMDHTYKRKPGPTLVPTASQKVVDDARRENEALIGKRELTGGKTPEELGKLIFNAFKTNNAKAWIKCIHGDGKYVDWKNEEVKFQQTRNEFAQQGLSDWSNTRFSRVRYQSDGEFYGYFKIEFTSGNEFVGIIELTSVVKKFDDKYLVYRAGENGNTRGAFRRK